MIRKGNKHNVWANGNTIAHYCTTLFLFPFLYFLSFPVPGMYGLMDIKTATSSTLFSGDSLHCKTEG